MVWLATWRCCQRPSSMPSLPGLCPGAGAAGGWQWQEFDETTLAQKGLAPSGGGPWFGGRSAAIVRLSYCPANPVRRVALVGRGSRHDSGGYNLKVGGSMYGMHLDMGAARWPWHRWPSAGRNSPLRCTAGSPSPRTIGPQAFRPGEGW